MNDPWQKRVHGAQNPRAGRDPGCPRVLPQTRLSQDTDGKHTPGSIQGPPPEEQEELHGPIGLMENVLTLRARPSSAAPLNSTRLWVCLPGKLRVSRTPAPQQQQWHEGRKISETMPRLTQLVPA